MDPRPELIPVNSVGQSIGSTKIFDQKSHRMQIAEATFQKC